MLKREPTHRPGGRGDPHRSRRRHGAAGAAAPRGDRPGPAGSQSVVGKEAAGQARELPERRIQTEGKGFADKARATQRPSPTAPTALSQEKLGEAAGAVRGREHQGAPLHREEAARRRQDARRRVLKEIEEKLQPVLDKVQSNGNYDLILNRALGVVVMASERVDITEAVIVAFDEAEAAGGSE